RMAPHSAGAETGAVSNSSTEFKSVRSDIRILFAEDTPFFRKQVGAVLTGAGFNVQIVNDGQAALEMLESSDPSKFSIVLSDVEMPRMNGLELAKNIRSNPALKNLPMIALTTKFSERHVKEGLQAGFTNYLEKMNPEKLIQELDRISKERRAA
ncbi:MAG: response regulator, partial [Deltaproteobacteria bacterium]